YRVPAVRSSTRTPGLAGTGPSRQPWPQVLVPGVGGYAGEAPEDHRDAERRTRRLVHRAELDRAGPFHPVVPRHVKRLPLLPGEAVIHAPAEAVPLRSVVLLYSGQQGIENGIGRVVGVNFHRIASFGCLEGRNSLEGRAALRCPTRVFTHFHTFRKPPGTLRT